ncbi:MAG: ZIP family metal transporter [Elusimicrobia bacterium]|nr:ZIP family metal transporter [Elusimicrobiota bacterium]
MLTALAFALGSVLATSAGGFLILRQKGWAENTLWRFLAFGSGVLLGMTFLHLLPEAWELSARWAGGSVLLSFVLFFVVEEHTVLHACGEVMGKCRVHSLGYGALVALFLHSLADGLAMAFSFMSSMSLGLIVSTAILIHKFSDGLTLSSLLMSTNFSRRRAAIFVVLLSSATPLGVVLGMGFRAQVTDNVLAVLLGLAAGGFLYVSTADILPRIHQTRDKICWVFLLAGMAVSGLFPHH